MRARVRRAVYVCVALSKQCVMHRMWWRWRSSLRSKQVVLRAQYKGRLKCAVVKLGQIGRARVWKQRRRNDRFLCIPKRLKCAQG